MRRTQETRPQRLACGCCIYWAGPNPATASGCTVGKRLEVALIEGWDGPTRRADAEAFYAHLLQGGLTEAEQERMAPWLALARGQALEARS